MGARIKFINMERIPDTRLRYLEERPKHNNRRQALFLCDCGKQLETDLNWVRFKSISSCGCLKSELVSDKNTKHNHAIRGQQTGAYRSWQAMHQRVQVNPAYQHVSICRRWNDFEAFYADMGERPDGHSIERKNNVGDYEPNNCVWATQLEQAQNTRNTKLITINGITLSINEWCRKVNIGYHVYKQRIRRGFTPEQAITTPINKSKQGRRRS